MRLVLAMSSSTSAWVCRFESVCFSVSVSASSTGEPIRHSIHNLRRGPAGNLSNRLVGLDEVSRAHEAVACTPFAQGAGSGPVRIVKDVGQILAVWRFEHPDQTAPDRHAVRCCPLVPYR